MKNFISTFTLIFLMMSMNSFQIKAQDVEESALNKKINTHMSYPVFAEKDMFGDVNVHFKILEDGSIDVISIDSSNPNLIPFVLTRLDKIVLPLNDASIGTTRSVVFNFKKEGNERS